ncbi:MAG TPA: pilus assembly protein PilM [Bacilli bacterium]|nr:pilus assembly protein PilM [Bacilli bacterium]
MLGIRSDHALGLEITDRRLLLAEVSKRRDGYHLQEIVQTAVPSEVMAEGKIKQLDTLVELIKNSLQSANIRSKKVNLVVPSQFVVIRQLKLPDLPTAGLRKVIDFELQNTIHLPFEDPIYDVVKLGPVTATLPAGDEADVSLALQKTEPEPQGPQAEVALIASSRAAIDPFVEAATRAGLKPTSVDIRALALHRAFRTLCNESDGQTFMFVDVSEDATDIHIFHGDVLKFTRNIPMALDQYKIDRERSKPLNVLDILTFLEENTDYRSYTNDLAYEIERSLNFFRYTLNNRDAALGTIILSGVLPRSGVLADLLSERLSGLMVFALPFPHLQLDESVREAGAMLCQYAIPIGLALKEV